MLGGNLNAGTYSQCAALDKYRLPHAIVQVENRSFVTWNRTFLSLPGFSMNFLFAVSPQLQK
jgi:hypothetical protein